MKINIANIVVANKLPLLVAIIAQIVIFSLTSYFDDITISLYILILFSIFTALSIFIILNPWWGLLFMIIYTPCSTFIEIPMIKSGQRVFILIVAIGWFLKYFMQGKSVFIQLLKSENITILFILSMLISSAIAFKPMISFNTTIIIIAYIFMAFIMQDLINNEKKMQTFIMVIALSVGLVSLSGVIQYIGIDVGYTTSSEDLIRYSGIYENPNGYAMVLMSGIPYLIFFVFNTRSFIFKALCFLLFLTSFVSLCLTLSRAFIIMFVVFFISYILLCYKHKTIEVKKILTLLIIITMLSLIVSYFFIDNIIARVSENISEKNRYFILLKGINLLKEYPLFGIGFRNFPYVNPSDSKYFLSTEIGEHEIVSSVFASIGVFGSVILISIFYRILKYLNRATMEHSSQSLLNFIIVLKASYIAYLSTAIGTGLIFTTYLWTYYALSIIIHRWSRLRDVEYFAKSIKLPQKLDGAGQ